jgi:hypothetical protein
VPRPFHPDTAQQVVRRVFTTCWFLNNFKTYPIPSTTAPQTTQTVSARKMTLPRSCPGMTGHDLAPVMPLHDRGKGVKTSAYKSKLKSNRPWLELRRIEKDDHEHPGWKLEGEAMFCTWHRKAQLVTECGFLLRMSEVQDWFTQATVTHQSSIINKQALESEIFNYQLHAHS